MKLSAVVIARNEEANIGECLKSLSFCDEVVVVDSGSQDRTVSLANGLGARVTQRNFDNFASQKNFALSCASFPWVLSIDADERVSGELRGEIQKAIGGLFAPPAAYRMPRHNLIFGRRFRFGGNGSDAPVRLFQKERARFSGLVHETLLVDGPVGRFKGALLHASTPSAGVYLRKLNGYTGLEAECLREKGRSPRKSDFFLKPLFRFWQRFFLQLGFLDGREGFFFHLLSAYYEFVRYAKLWEISEGKFDKIQR